MISKHYLAKGEEYDGIKYEVYLNGDNLLCNVTYKDLILTKEFRLNYKPRAGWDISDINNSEQIMEELITEIRNKIKNNPTK